MIEIRKNLPEDHDQIWTIIQQVISTGDTYVFDPASSKEEMLAYWFAENKYTYVAIQNERIVGTFRLGYKAMQFNIVVKSNERAVQLWKNLGFTIIGEIPEAFNHKQNGLTNAYIMYCKL